MRTQNKKRARRIELARRSARPRDSSRVSDVPSAHERRTTTAKFVASATIELAQKAKEEGGTRCERRRCRARDDAGESSSPAGHAVCSRSSPTQAACARRERPPALARVQKGSGGPRQAAAARCDHGPVPHLCAAASSRIPHLVRRALLHRRLVDHDAQESRSNCQIRLRRSTAAVGRPRPNRLHRHWRAPPG